MQARPGADRVSAPGAADQPHDTPDHSTPSDRKDTAMFRTLLAALLRSLSAAPQPAAPTPTRPVLPRHQVIMTDAPASPAVATPPRPTTRSGKIYCPDRLALVVFDQEARLAAPFMGAFDPRLVDAVQGLPGLVRDSITDIAAGLSMANDLLADQHPGLLRRIWLLSDGYPNPENQPIDRMVSRAIAQRTNINTIGIGLPGGYDRALLERIAARTHNGRFAEAQTAADLNRIFGGAARPRKPGSHRGEATVFVVDVSGSMRTPMGPPQRMGATQRIDAVSEAMSGLLRYKQARWS